MFTQIEPNDLSSDFGLKKEKAEWRGCRLKENNLLEVTARIYMYRKKEYQFFKYFGQENDQCTLRHSKSLMSLVSNTKRATGDLFTYTCLLRHDAKKTMKT